MQIYGKAHDMKGMLLKKKYSSHRMAYSLLSIYNNFFAQVR